MSQQQPPGYPPNFAPPPGAYPPPQAAPGVYPPPQAAPGGYPPPQAAPGGYPPPQAAPGGYPPPQAAPGGYPPPQAAPGGYPPPQAAPGGYPPPQAAPGGYPPPQAAPGGYPGASPFPPGAGGPVPPGAGGPVPPGLANLPGRGFPGRGRGAFDAEAIAGSNMAGTRLPYFLDGEYVVECEKTLVTQRKPTFIAECLIHQSSNPNRPQGARAAWGQSLSDPDVAYPAVKRFSASGIGCNTEQEVAMSGHNMAQLLNAMADPDQPASTIYQPNPFKGRWFRLIVTTVQTKQNKPFTRHDWYPYTVGV